MAGLRLAVPEPQTCWGAVRDLRHPTLSAAEKSPKEVHALTAEPEGHLTWLKGCTEVLEASTLTLGGPAGPIWNHRVLGGGRRPEAEEQGRMESGWERGWKPLGCSSEDGEGLSTGASRSWERPEKTLTEPRRSQPCPRLDFRLLSSRTGENKFVVFLSH